MERVRWGFGEREGVGKKRTTRKYEELAWQFLILEELVGTLVSLRNASFV